MAWFNAEFSQAKLRWSMIRDLKRIDRFISNWIHVLEISTIGQWMLSLKNQRLNQSNYFLYLYSKTIVGMGQVDSNRASIFHWLNQFNCIALNILLICLDWFLILFLNPSSKIGFSPTDFGKEFALVTKLNGFWNFKCIELNAGYRSRNN